jgi:hypothetical protein
VSAYLTRELLELVGEDGTTITVEAGDYLEGVDPWGLSLRDRTRWCDVLRRVRAIEGVGQAVVVLEVGARYALGRIEDLILLVDE